MTDLEREATRRGEWMSRLSFGTRSYLTIPLRVDGRVVGAFGLGSLAIGQFTEDDIEMLSPLMELFELVLAECTFVPPLFLEPPSLIDGQPVVLITLDASLSESVAADLPKCVQARYAEDIEAAEAEGFAVLWVVCSARLTRKLAQKIARSLRRSPRRTLIFCQEASPGTVHYLVTQTGRFGLLAIIDPHEVVDRRLWLASWYFAGVVVPEWQALGVDSVNDSDVVGRVLMAIEHEPFRDWRVDELARCIGVSTRTLRRSLLEETGFNAKEFLMAVRYQLVDRLRKEGRLKGAEMAELFGFASNKHMYDWCARYENNHTSISGADEVKLIGSR